MWVRRQAALQGADKVGTRNRVEIGIQNDRKITALHQRQTLPRMINNIGIGNAVTQL